MATSFGRMPRKRRGFNLAEVIAHMHHPPSNLLLELAVAAAANSVITFNVSDFRGELRFPEIKVVTPSQFLKMKR